MPIDAAPGVLETLDWAAKLVGRREAELMLGHILGCSRAQLYADLVDRSPEHLATFDDLVAQRLRGEPLQYITGVQAFRGLSVVVGPGVLVPRPETELLVEEALSLIGSLPNPVVVDVGTGSGAIALSIATEHPSSEIWATEIDEKAIGWARRNLLHSGVRIVQGDLLSPLPAGLTGKVDLIVSNPPYLSETEWQSAPFDVRHHEPVIALKSEREGLDVTERLIGEALHWLAPQGWLILETSPSLTGDVRRLLSAGYAEVAILDDLAGRPRVARGRRP
jgi:release factor glutamine methyltransferase